MNKIEKPSMDYSPEQIDAAIARARLARSETFHEIFKGVGRSFTGLFGQSVTTGRPVTS